MAESGECGDEYIQRKYLCGGAKYNITETRRMHACLMDAQYLLKYLGENEDILQEKESRAELNLSEPESLEEKYFLDENTPSCSWQTNFKTAATANIQKRTNKTGMNDSLKLSWNTSNTKLLISEYKKRLEQFRSPKIKKKPIWEAIAQIFKKNGYNITVQELDCKMRNIKHHYKTIKDNNRNKTGRGRIVWEYYDLVDELFLDDKTINHGKILNSMESGTHAEIDSSSSIMSSESQNSCHQFSTIKSIDVIKTPTLKRPFSQVSLNSTNKTLSSIQRKENDNCEALSTPKSSETKKKLSNSSKATAARGLYHTRVQYLESEKRRVTAIENLVKEISENNNIQRERNELLRKYLGENQ